MKKVVLSMMLATGLLMGGSAYAQNQTDGTTGATKQNTEKYEAGPKGKKDGKAAKGKKGDKSKKNKGQKGNRQQFNPFDGVQLTADQQQRLQVLRQGLGPVVLDKEQMKNIPENPNLTPEQKAQLKKERKAKKQEAKKNYLNGVKEILTPDQYVIFLENCYLYSPQPNNGHAKGMKEGKSPKKFNKPAGQQ